MYTQGYNIYKNNSVNYASKDKLLLMLVDGAVKFSKIARQAIVKKDIKTAHENILKTENIFAELMISLDRTQGEWTDEIFRVYEFINYKLVEANLSKKVEVIDEVIPLIEQVRDLWYEVDKKAKRG